MDGEQAIVKFHVVGSHHTFKAVTAETPTQFERGSGFGLDAVTDGFKARLGCRERRSTGGRADQRAGVFTQSAVDLLLVSQLVDETYLRQEVLAGLDAAGFVGTGHCVCIDIHLHGFGTQLDTQGVGRLP